MRRQTGQRANGMTLIYLVCAMTALVGFTSLAVDWGRVQLVRTELQRAADAAARYGAAGAINGASAAQANAISAAADNLADGTPVVLTASDVASGHWDPTAGTFTANGTPRDAVQITARRTAATNNPVPLYWGRLLPGGPRSLDVTATAIAYAEPVVSGLFGNYVNEGININGNSQMDSYDSHGASYAATRSGTITISGNFQYMNMNGANAMIDGTVYYTGGLPNGTVTGGKVKIDASDIPASMKTPSSTPAGATNMGNYNGGNLTLNSGNYYFTSFSTSGNSVISINATNGPVRLYVNGAFSLSGNISFAYTQGNDPADLELHMVSAAGVDLNGNIDVWAVVHAPNSPLNLNGNTNIYGSICVKQVSLSGNTGVHWDKNLPRYGGAPMAGPISIVK
jgi:hypothetical protein